MGILKTSPSALGDMHRSGKAVRCNYKSKSGIVCAKMIRCTDPEDGIDQLLSHWRDVHGTVRDPATGLWLEGSKVLGRSSHG